MSTSQPGPWAQEIDELAQSMTRALIFGIALICTMEAWWVGEYLDIWKLLLFFFLALLVNMYLLPVATDNTGMPFWKIVRKSVRNKGVSVLASFLLLLLLGRISPLHFPLERDVATVLLLSIPVSIGSDVAHIYRLYPSGKNQQKSAGSNRQKPWRFILNDIASSSGGALFVALPMAPTMEIPMLAARMGFWREMTLILVSIFLSHMIVYGTGVSRTPPSGEASYGAKVWPYADALMSYMIALLVAAVVLFLFGRINLGAPIPHVLSLVVTLGLPAGIGAAAGKLVL